MGTKLRHFSSVNPREVEAFIEGLSFKVEVKYGYELGGRHYVWFTMMDKELLPNSELPSPEEKVPPVKTSRRTRTRKKKI